jgi:hypothetical protein
MGDCRHCGKPAGFLRSTHKECEATHKSGVQKCESLIQTTAKDGSDIDTLENNLKEIAKANFISESQLKSLVIDGWGKAVEAAFEDNVLSSEEEEVLTKIEERFNLTQDDLNKKGAYMRFNQGGALRDVLEDKIPERLYIKSGQLPFNLQKDEKLVWIFQGVKYFEQKTMRQYVGGSSGVSIRVAKGVYFRTSGFSARPVDTTETVQADNGILGITTKHLYFAGAYKSFRIPYPKIVSFMPYGDGIGVQRDAATAKPQSFITGDGWFIYNLVTNLSRIYLDSQ